jgi:hypothetical protein
MFKLAGFLAVLLGSTAAYAAPMGANGMIHTPAGDRAPSCVYELPSGSRIVTDQTITFPKNVGGTATVPKCVSPASPPSANGWVMQAGDNSGNNSFVLETGYFIVPPAPTVNQGQVIYFFNGIQVPGVILQPVLMWGYDGPYWEVASWRCGAGSSNCYFSTPTKPAVGDVISGSTSYNATSGDWTIIGADITNGQNSTLVVTGNAAGGTEGEAWGGVLEAYDVTTCSGYPGVLAEPFFDSTEQRVSGSVILNPVFVGKVLDSDCGEAVNTQDASLVMNNAVLATGGGGSGGSGNSPDGTIIYQTSGGMLVNAQGTWTFGATLDPYGQGQHQILLNGSASSWPSSQGFAQELEVDHGGVLYSLNTKTNLWYSWSGTAWVQTSAP